MQLLFERHFVKLIYVIEVRDNVFRIKSKTFYPSCSFTRPQKTIQVHYRLWVIIAESASSLCYAFCNWLNLNVIIYLEVYNDSVGKCFTFSSSSYIFFFNWPLKTERNVKLFKSVKIDFWKVLHCHRSLRYVAWDFQWWLELRRLPVA